MPFICDFEGSIPVGKPKDWVDDLDGECGAIYVAAETDVLTGLNKLHTVYKFTDEEVIALLNGGLFRLTICSNIHPVIQMAVLGPQLAEKVAPIPKYDLGGVIEC